MTDTEKLIKTLDARYAAGQIGFQEGVSALANHDALKTAKRLDLALAAIEAAKELISAIIDNKSNDNRDTQLAYAYALEKWVNILVELEAAK